MTPPLPTRPPAADSRPDADLLARFLADRDEAAFAALVQRHTPGVRAACRGWLRAAADIDDAAQATFLVLVRRADSIRDKQALGRWLYRTAEFTARRLKKQLATAAPLPADVPGPAAEPDDLADEVAAEVARLPEAYRRAVQLCYAGGLTAAAAAERLGVPRGTVLSHLSRGREMLKRRLAARGLAPAAAVTTPAVSGSWVWATARAASAVRAGVGSTERSVHLSQGVADAMSWNKLRLVAAVAVVTTGTLGFVVGQWAAADLPKLTKPAAEAKKEPAMLPPEPLPAKAKPDDAKPPVPARRREAVIRMPQGTFTKEADAGQYGSGRMTWTYDDDRVTGTIEANVMGVEVEIATEAEISLSSNGTIYGLITSAKVTKLKLGGLAAELQQFAGMVSLAEPLLNELLTDMPFSYQFRVSGDRLVILSYRIMLAGPNPIVKYAGLAGGGEEVAAIALYFGAIGTAIEGTYTAIDPDQVPAKRPARKPAAKKGE